MTKLTPKQQRFVEEYLIDLNGTQAAIRAGYSAKTANRIASENLSKPVIQDAVKAAQSKLSERMEITHETVIQRLMKISDDDDCPHAAAITGWTNIGKHLGMFVDRQINENYNFVVTDSPDTELTEEQWSDQYGTTH